MLEIIIICLLTMGLNWLIKKAMNKKIAAANTAQQSVSYRKKYRVLRLFILILFTIVIVCEFVYCCSLLLDSYTSNTYRHILNMILIIGVTYASMSLPISSMTIGQFDESSPFALYLRGFAKDNYDPQNALEKIEKISKAKNGIGTKEKDPQELSFSEREFYKAIKEYMPVYSVGMTKELESPEGTKRIYLDDETWQENVAFLISRATYVFVLVNPSENCIWEVNKCLAEAKDKAVFFVDNEESANVLREKLQSAFPETYGVYNKIAKNTMVYYPYQVHSYLNNYEGYRKALATLWGIELTNDKRNVLLNIIALLFPFIGFIVFILNKKTKPLMSKSILKFSCCGVLLKVIMIIYCIIVS